MAISTLAKSSIGTFDRFQKTSGGNASAQATIVASGAASGTQGVTTSTDGITWTFTAATWSPTTKFVYFKRDNIYYGHQSSALVKSPNGTTWIPCSYPFSANNTGAFDLKLTANPNDFTFTYCSVNGTGNSIERLAPASGTIGVQPQSTGVSNDFFIVGDSSGNIYTRGRNESLFSWTYRAGIGGQTLDMECVGNTCVIGSTSGFMHKSTNGGTTWTSAGRAGTVGFKQTVRYINGIWFALTNGALQTESGFHFSTDLSSWTQRSIDSQTDIRDIHFANGLWIALFNSGRIYTSPDLTTWTQRSSNITQGYYLASTT